jgi:hypothetical protein
MTANSEDRYEDRPPGLTSTVLPVLLGLLALFAFSGSLVGASGLVAAKMSARPPWTPQQPGLLLALSLLAGAGAIWGLWRLRPSRAKTGALTMVLACVALDGFIGAGSIVKVLLASNTLWRPEVWAGPTRGFLAANLLLVIISVAGLRRLKPWKGWTSPRQPVSPATRKANALYGLKELGAAVAVLVLVVGSFSTAHPYAVISNSPIPLWVAIVAISTWLLARFLREWWGGSADEHERAALDFGRRVGCGVFFAVTPAWWVAARAGLMPQPDAMILWLVIQVVVTAAWTWRRYN